MSPLISGLMLETKGLFCINILSSHVAAAVISLPSFKTSSTSLSMSLLRKDSRTSPPGTPGTPVKKGVAIIRGVQMALAWKKLGLQQPETNNGGAIGLDEMERRVSCWNTLSLESAFSIHRPGEQFDPNASKRRRHNTFGLVQVVQLNDLAMFEQQMFCLLQTTFKSKEDTEEETNGCVSWEATVKHTERLECDRPQQSNMAPGDRI
ncbi:hypothetical protein J6590_022237 [Homalodisca vitripennis]|nr:hypothetical protein J6590_022237 [Homalodisca vitripennis]